MNMIDIARELGISIATVSRVVNGHSNVSEKTKKKVLEYIEKNGYIPNAIAQNLSKQENKTIAVLVPNIDNFFFATLINYVCKYFTQGGYQISLYNTLEDLELEKKAIKSIMEQRIAGVIAILIKGKYEENPLIPLIKRKIPTYLLDRDLEKSDLSGVFIDNYKGAYQITNELIKRGHKDIAIITGKLDFLNARERLKGYRAALEDSKIPYNPKNVYEGDYHFESGYLLGKQILKRDHTAIFASNNLMLYGFIKALKENKNRKGLELSCFEKTDIMEIFNINVISGTILAEEMGKEIYKLFLNREENKKIYIEPLLDKKELE